VTEGDDRWISAAVAGDARAFAVGVRQHAPVLKQLARAMGVPDTDVDDVVQDSLIAAWRALAEFDRARPFRPWLVRIAVNKIRDLQRFRRVRYFLFAAMRLGEGEGQALPDEGAGPERTLSAQADLAHIAAILNRIEPGLREAIVLTAFVGMSQAEAAATLGVSPKTVEGRVLRARGKLAQYLAR